jgi:hypothetical protein
MTLCGAVPIVSIVGAVMTARTSAGISAGNGPLPTRAVQVLVAPPTSLMKALSEVAVSAAT